MRPFLLLSLVLACVPAAAQTYKWVDENGVTTYGTKPPAGRAAQRVDTESRNTIDTRPVPARAAPAPAPVPPPPAAGVPAARGMAFDTYIRLERGMSEGELLGRAGPPDYATLDDEGYPVKTFYYYPTRTEPFTTIVRLRGGRIDTLERTKKF